MSPFNSETVVSTADRQAPQSLAKSIWPQQVRKRAERDFGETFELKKEDSGESPRTGYLNKKWDRISRITATCVFVSQHPAWKIRTLQNDVLITKNELKHLNCPGQEAAYRLRENIQLLKSIGQKNKNNTWAASCSRTICYTPPPTPPQCLQYRNVV